MRRRGPSPLVPSLMVTGLGLVILAPYLLPHIIGTRAEETSSPSYVMLVVSLILLFLIQFLAMYVPILCFSSSSSYQQASISGSDSDGFGFGAILLVLLFLILNRML